MIIVLNSCDTILDLNLEATINRTPLVVNRQTLQIGPKCLSNKWPLSQEALSERGFPVQARLVFEYISRVIFSASPSYAFLLIIYV